MYCLEIFAINMQGDNDFIGNTIRQEEIYLSCKDAQYFYPELVEKLNNGRDMAQKIIVDNNLHVEYRLSKIIG